MDTLESAEISYICIDCWLFSTYAEKSPPIYPFSESNGSENGEFTVSSTVTRIGRVV